jgi:PhnB protein
MTIKPIPDGYHAVTPYLVVDGAETLLDFVKKAFGADETVRMPGPDGRIGHAEVKIGDSIVMLGDAWEEAPARPSTLHLYVVDSDATYNLALEAGGESVREPEDQFYGDRMAGVRDPVGNTWWISTHVEDVSDDEMRRRAQERAEARTSDSGGE